MTRARIPVAALLATFCLPMAANAGPIYFNPENNHAYEYVWFESADDKSWTSAEAAASSSMYAAVQGYLVTITSQSEQDFITSNFEIFNGSWIGASDAATEGVWEWVTGPEAGTVFWDGGPVGGEFSFWNTGEPNDSGGEDYAAYDDVFSVNSWNDLGNDEGMFVGGYIIEYDVPEPATLGLIGIGLLGLGLARRRRR